MRSFSATKAVTGGSSRNGEGSNSQIPSHVVTLRVPAMISASALVNIRASMKFIGQGSRHGSLLPGIRIRVR